MKSIKDLFIESNSDKQSGHRYGFIYDLLFTKVFTQKGEKLSVLEIGVSAYGDGSLKAYADSEMAKHVVGIDVEDYRGKLTDKMRFHKLDAYTKESVAYLKGIEGTFDIIIDDGTHIHEHQEFFLEHYTDLLTDNGLLVCEDVSSVKLINEQCQNDDIFFFDGWGNREVKLKSFESPELYKHNERILIKAKSEKLTDAKRHENKAHIVQLPVVKFEDYERVSTELAVSVPLFHPELDSYNATRFQDVHVKGAIWAGLSLIKNSDLGDQGVPLYFHIEDKVWDDAMPVFKAFDVPKDWCRKMVLPKTPDADCELKVTTKPQFGKSWMGLTDEGIDPDVLLILDSDLFTCVTDKKFQLYDKLTLPILKNQPSMTYFQMRDFPYYWWVSIVLLASGLPDHLMYKQPIDTLEKEAYERLGLEKDRKDTAPNDTISGYYAEDYLMTFPREHPARDFAIEHMSACYATPYLFSMWAEYHQPFVELSQILKIPVYDWEKHFIEGRQGYDCFSHIRVEKTVSKALTMPSRIHEYWDNFFDNVSRHV